MSDVKTIWSNSCRNLS